MVKNKNSSKKEWKKIPLSEKYNPKPDKIKRPKPTPNPKKK
jgi:hypothetical protein